MSTRTYRRPFLPRRAEARPRCQRAYARNAVTRPSARCGSVLSVTEMVGEVKARLSKRVKRSRPGVEGAAGVVLQACVQGGSRQGSRPRSRPVQNRKVSRDVGPGCCKPAGRLPRTARRSTANAKFGEGVRLGTEGDHTDVPARATVIRTRRMVGEGPRAGTIALVGGWYLRARAGSRRAGRR